MTKDIEAGSLVLRHWRAGTRMKVLPAECRPFDRREGYAAQAALARASGERALGWKIAATSSAGQQHIGVDGPLAGRLLAERVVNSDAPISMTGNLMRVVEAEFAFRMARPLPPRTAVYSMEEVTTAIDTLHPAIELPDSRFDGFAQVGTPTLIADNACAGWFVLGAATPAPWWTHDLARHPVTVTRNGAPAAEGNGAMVLGGPLIAMHWIANELREYGPGLAAGDIVTTGTCIVPLPVNAGDRIEANFGEFGRVGVTLE